jgi:STE24 endopeptidase
MLGGSAHVARAPRVLIRSRAARIGVVAVAMIVVAEAAVWLLRPRDPPLEPLPVSATDYFTEAQIERGRDYREGQLWLFVAGLGAEAAVLLILALGRPTAVRGALERIGRRPLVGAAAVGAGLSLAVTAAGFPASVWAHERSVDVGLSTQSFGEWLGDVGKSAAIGAVLAAAGATLLIALVRRFGRVWWVPGSVAVVALAAVFTWLAPVLLAPIFNRFDPLPDNSPVRADVLELGERAGVDIGEVYRVDASRRSTSLNAYVTGLGPTKRVVLYDNLIAGTDRGELNSIVAHELGHVEHSDIRRGIAFVALVAPLGLLFTSELGGALAGRAGINPRRPAALPAYALALGLASLILGVPGNQLSRKVEASADEFALELTDDSRALIEVQRRLAIANVSDPDPPDVVSFLLRTHPTTVERIGAAEAFREEVLAERP